MWYQSWSTKEIITTFECTHTHTHMCTHRKRDMLSISWNAIFEYFSKICWENSSFILMTGITCHMKTNVHLWSLSHSLLLRMRIVSDKSCRGNHNTHFMFSNLFWKLCHLWDVEKHVEWLFWGCIIRLCNVLSVHGADLY